jgi:uncharacterized protein
MADRFDTRFDRPQRLYPDAVDPRDTTRVDAGGVDAGLRKHMLTVYNYMGSAVLLTGIVALLFASSGAVYSLVGVRGMSPLGWIVALAPLGIALWMSFGFQRMSAATAQFLFWTYAVLLGMSLSTLLLVYTASSVATAFFAAAVAFGSLSLWGYTTKRDLSGFGTFLIMGVFGLFAAMLLTAIIPGQNPAVTMTINVLGVLIFAGLTAFHTQMIKNLYYAAGLNADERKKYQIMGALNLYVDFINMFLFILRMVGDRR